MKTTPIAPLVAAALALTAHAALAADPPRRSVEAVHQTTQKLIEELVIQGVITQQRAEELVRSAEARAGASADPAPEAPAAADAAGRKAEDPVRVQFVPEHVKAEIREELRDEVLKRARRERWATPGAIPEWARTLDWEGDLRVRYQFDAFADENARASDYVFESWEDIMAASGFAAVDPTVMTRAADFARVNDQAEPLANTHEARRRMRVRGRLGFVGRLSDRWAGGVRFTTGTTGDRVSTNQTLGQDFNKYSMVVERAYVQYDPTAWLTVLGGRFSNPWLGTDLVWDEDLHFDGIAATYKPAMPPPFTPFLTAGIFPILEENPPSSDGRWMAGVQLGTQIDPDLETQYKLAIAVYDFPDLEGRVESNAALDPVSFEPFAADYGQYEYRSRLRQKGNTLFRTNAPLDAGDTSYWGLASKFRPLNVTGSVDLAQFEPMHINVTAEWVKNLAYDRAEIARRTEGRAVLTDGDDKGYQLRFTYGHKRVRDGRDWQVSLAYRYLGSDAVVDGLTDSDFGGGGTNLKGYVLGYRYGLDRNAALAIRWLSADQIDSFTLNPAHRFSLDVLQADINVRF
jgi:hypothetical protein